MPCADLKNRRLVFDQAYQRYRRLADGGGEAGKIVEAGLAPGLEHAIAAQGRKTRALLRAGRKLARRDRGAWAFDRHAIGFL